MGSGTEWGSEMQQAKFEIDEEGIRMDMIGKIEVKEKRIEELQSFFNQKLPGTL